MLISLLFLLLLLLLLLGAVTAPRVSGDEAEAPSSRSRPQIPAVVKFPRASLVGGANDFDAESLSVSTGRCLLVAARPG